MDANWPQAFAKTESFEGWHKFSNDKYDPGGATYDGVIQKTYDAWRRLNKQPIQNVRFMTDEECASIMKTQYWLAGHCDVLFSGLDVLIYDINVNMGVGRGIRLLQQALGVTADGVFGIHTAAAVSGTNDQEALIRKVAALRMSFWHALTTWWRYGKGWSNRGNGELQFALQILKALPKAGASA